MSHYYKLDGSPCYEIESKNGKGLRSVTIRDARELKLVPSVTTIIGVLDKPGLLKYKFKQIVSACVKRPKKLDEAEDVYFEKIIQLSKEESKNAASRGSDLHEMLDKVLSQQLALEQLTEETQSFIQPVFKKIVELAPSFSSDSTEESFSHELGFGGKVDYNNRKNNIVIDFKTKDTNDIKKFYKYDDHLMQLAAYREGLQMPTARCFDIYFSSVEPGIVEVHEWTEEQLKKGWEMFKSLLQYWQVANNYNSSFVVHDIVREHNG